MPRLRAVSLTEGVWEKIHTAFNDAELHLIAGILAGEGIECRVKSCRVSQLPFAHHALGAVEIYVQKSEAPHAQRILMVYRNR
jgi:Putative prokaryotic signal transducing protein